MDFELTEAQRLIRDTVREFAEKELAPIAGELDRLKTFPEKPIQRLIVSRHLLGRDDEQERRGEAG